MTPISFKPFMESLRESLNTEDAHWRKIHVGEIYECTNCGGCVQTADIESYKYCFHCGKKIKGVYR